MSRILTLFLLSLIIPCAAFAQSYPQNDFIPPLDVPLKLSGTFGELRANHFHSGIDLKTGEMEGLKVYAVADGYVSRIKVQSGGYGKAIYVTHPNGYVSVYGHLSKYNSSLDGYVIRKQYDNKSYEIDLYPGPDLFPVRQGEVIAYSGNTGRSGGPHLHFEIRGAADQWPINPLHFHFAVADNTPPLISLVKIYPYGKGSRIEGSAGQKEYYTVNEGSTYALKGADTLTASGIIQFGINTYDPFNGGLNKNGVYSISLFTDGEMLYGHKLERFSFDETRYINSLIDYPEYKTKSRRVQKSFLDPNNKLSIYTVENHQGLRVEEGKKYQVRYEVSDIAGNTSVLEFWIRGVEGPQGKGKPDQKDGEQVLFSWKHNNEFTADGVRLSVPGRTLYDTLTFEYERKAKRPDSYSPVHGLHHDYTPLHSWCELSITPEAIDELISSKYLIVKIEDDGQRTPCGGEFRNGELRTKVREFGDYCVVLDTVPPLIRPVNIAPNKSLLAQNTIQVKITDELSGIATYNGYLGEQWILMEYDEKNDLLTYHFDSNLKEGENLFRLEVTDERNNRAVYEVTLNY